jgi:hypothetical protein
MVLGNGIGHFTTDAKEAKERAIGQGMQSYSKRLNWTQDEGNYTFGSDYVIQASQKNIWNQFMLSANSQRVGWQSNLRASNLGNFTGAGRMQLNPESFDTQYFMQGDGVLQGSVIDGTGKHPEWVTTTFVNGSFVINSHVNISKPCLSMLTGCHSVRQLSSSPCWDHEGPNSTKRIK